MGKTDGQFLNRSAQDILRAGRTKLSVQSAKPVPIDPDRFTLTQL